MLYLWHSEGFSDSLLFTLVVASHSAAMSLLPTLPPKLPIPFLHQVDLGLTTLVPPIWGQVSAFLELSPGYILKKHQSNGLSLLYFVSDRLSSSPPIKLWCYLLKIAQNSFQHLDFDGSLWPLFITWCHNHGIKKTSWPLVNTLLTFSFHSRLP